MTTKSQIKSIFPTEAALCDLFIRDIRAMGGWTVYPETGGFDILCVRDDTGHQLGIEAKLSLNAKVVEQIIPSDCWASHAAAGPDFRAVIVPQINDSSAGIAELLRIIGVKVLTPHLDFSGPRFLLHPARSRLRPDVRAFDTSGGPLSAWDLAWHDWNPVKRCELPEIVPQVPAGVPAPVRLTPWKIGALKVIVDLDLDGFVTAASVREHSVDPRRFCASDGWLLPMGQGRWGRGNLPRFELQHPEAYAELLSAAKQKRDIAKARQ